MMAGEVVSPGYSAMEETEIVNISSDGIITTQKENSRGNDNTFKVCFLKFLSLLINLCTYLIFIYEIFRPPLC